MNKKELQKHLLNEGVLKRVDEIQNDWYNFFYATSSMNNIKEIHKSELLKKIENNTMIFVYRLCNAIKDLKLMLTICNDNNLHNYTKEEIQACVQPLNTIKRCIKKELNTELECYLKQMSKDNIYKYNLKVCKAFKYKIQ